ncbi:MAG: hypothetical protein PHU05_04180 [Bacilli bacterium]|nr:hypothetical protein [Bacilli bacterium]
MIITTTSNSGLIKGCWLVLTGNASGSVVNLSSSFGGDISVSSSGATITVANNGAYATNATIIVLTNE